MRAERAGRAMRGALAGSLTTLLALTFHVAGGGASPGAAAICGSLLASVWICTMLAGRRLRPWLLVVAVAAAQLVLHTVFSMATASVAATPATPGAHVHAHGDVVVGALVHGGHAMWLAHVTAGALTVAGLLVGDRLLVAALGAGARIVRRILVAVAAPAPAPVPRIAAVRAAILPVLTARAVEAVSRRGPPVALTA